MFDWNTAYFKSGDPGLRPTYATMAVLAAYANFNDRTCYPSQRTLAEKLGYAKVDTIRAHIKQNIEAGWLRKIREGNSYTTTNMYEFVIPTPPVKRGSLEGRSESTPPAERGSAGTNSPRGKGESLGLPPPNGGNSPREKGGTPPADRVLTTKGTIQGTTQVPCSSDPFGGSEDISFSQPDRRSTTKETPPAERGSAPPVERGSSPKFGEPGFDPFAD